MHRDERRACCPTCGQRLAGVRLGVALGAFRARIFDAVKRAGRDGIATETLFDLIYHERPSSRQALKSNIHLINGLLVSTDWRIRAERESSSKGAGAGDVFVYRLAEVRE
jgi:hypothetical protein